MDDDNSGGQDPRLAGAREQFIEPPNVCTDSIGGGLISAGDYKTELGSSQIQNDPSGSSSSLLTSLNPQSSVYMPSMSQHDTSPKKPRTQFTPKQLRHLEEKFLENQFPNAKDREAIANELDLTQQHIQVWFQNRRAKQRRKTKRLKADDSTPTAPQPPSFWPANLPFDSNLAKGTSVDISTSLPSSAKKTGSKKKRSRSESPNTANKTAAGSSTSSSRSPSIPGSSGDQSVLSPVKVSSTPSSLPLSPTSPSQTKYPLFPLAVQSPEQLKVLPSIMTSAPSSQVKPRERPVATTSALISSIEVQAPLSASQSSTKMLQFMKTAKPLTLPQPSKGSHVATPLDIQLPPLDPLGSPLSQASSTTTQDSSHSTPIHSEDSSLQFALEQGSSLGPLFDPLPLSAPITSPPIFAESPVRLFDILDEIPDLMASLLDDPVVITSQSSTPQQQISQHPLSIPQVSTYVSPSLPPYPGYQNPEPIVGYGASVSQQLSPHIIPSSPNVGPLVPSLQDPSSTSFPSLPDPSSTSFPSLPGPSSSSLPLFHQLPVQPQTLPPPPAVQSVATHTSSALMQLLQTKPIVTSPTSLHPPYGQLYSPYPQSTLSTPRIPHRSHYSSHQTFSHPSSRPIPQRQLVPSSPLSDPTLYPQYRQQSLSYSNIMPPTHFTDPSLQTPMTHATTYRPSQQGQIQVQPTSLATPQTQPYQVRPHPRGL